MAREKNKLYLIIGTGIFSAAICIAVFFLNITPAKQITFYDPLLFDVFAFVFGTIISVDGCSDILNIKWPSFRKLFFPLIRIFVGVNIFTVHILLLLLKINLL